MKLKILHLFLSVDRQIEETPQQLRGFMGREFSKYVELHHHTAKGGGQALIHAYPRIQYNIHRNRAILVGIGERAILILKNLVIHIENITLGQNTYIVKEIQMHYEEPEFMVLPPEERITYEFKSAWLALNADNYKTFKSASIPERRSLLQKILIGNILSASKHLGYSVPSTIYVDLEMCPMSVEFKGIIMIGFKGIFETNFLLPDYIGIGKAVSHGHGIVKKIKSYLDD